MLTGLGQTFHKVLGVAVQQLFTIASHVRYASHYKYAISLEVRAVLQQTFLQSACGPKP